MTRDEKITKITALRKDGKSYDEIAKTSSDSASRRWKPLALARSRRPKTSRPTGTRERSCPASAPCASRRNDMSAFGLSNAITDVAGTFGHDKYELSTRMEHVGGEIIDLSAGDWKIIASATKPDEKKPRVSARERAAAGSR